MAMPDTLTPTEWFIQRRYKMLRGAGFSPVASMFIIRNCRKADAIGLDFEANGPFEVEYNGRTFIVATPDDEDPDTSWLEDVAEEDHPEGFYGLTVRDKATGEDSSLWGIDYDGRTVAKQLSCLAYLFEVFENAVDEIVGRIEGRTSHG